MPPVDLDTYVARSRGVDLSAFAWADVPRYPVSPEAIRTLRYMQDIESHTIIYLRELLSTRAVDEPDVATFLACWLYEETLHGIALARFLEAAGHPVGQRSRPRGQEPLVKRLELMAVALLSRAWPDFCALHMTWGAINELTTLTGYRRLAKVAGHPVLTALLERIMLDESRHFFFFYYRQAEERLRRPGVAPVARAIVDRFWVRSGAVSRRRRSSASWPAISSAATRGALQPARWTRPSPPARLRDGAAGRGMGRLLRRFPAKASRKGKWQPRRLSPIAPTGGGPSPAPSATR